MDLWNALHANLAIVLLLLALLVRNRLAEASSGDAGSAGTLARRRSGEGSAARQAVQYTTATLLLVAPLLFDPVSLREAEKVPALGIIFVSIVAVTGYSGQISLGQAGYAGLGALFCAKFSGGTPELVALLFGMLAAGIVGFLTGYPAIRRRGLFLALTTFAVGAVVSRFVFQQTFFTSGVRVHRPSLFGLALTGDHAFYGFELAMLALTFLVMRNLQSGPLGRSLIAVRDSEDGARSIGVDVRVLKMFIFTVSAVLAGLGGALLAQQAQTFNPNDFDPLQGSLFWFAAVVVFGADSAAGAIAAAGFVVLVDAVAGRSGTAEIAIGALAAFVGFMPGGAAEAARRIVDVVVTPTGLMRRFTATVPASRPAPELSPGGRVALQRLHARRREASR